MIFWKRIILAALQMRTLYREARHPEMPKIVAARPIAVGAWPLKGEFWDLQRRYVEAQRYLETLDA